MSPNADTGVWDLLDFSTSQHILTFLHPQEALQASSTCKLFHDQCEQPSLWKHFYEQYISEVQSSVQVEETKTNTLPASNSETDWKTRVHKALAVKDVKFGRWEKIVQDKGTRRPKTEPCPREGHAGQSWGDNGSMILFGGWGCGIRNDTYILRPCNPHDSASSSSAGAPTTSATPPDGGAGSSCPGAQAAGTTTQEQGGDPKVDGKSPMKLFTQWVASTSREPAPCFEWTAPVTQGTLPSIRYGHTATRCGTKGEMLLIFGGMQRGGYSGEINSLAVLKPATADLPAGSDTAAASSGPSTLEWVHPNLEGPELTARGYHASCASPCGKKVFLFGGLGDHGCNNVLEVVDVTTWRCESPATSGTPPSARFGNSMVVYDKKLWVIGGGFGYDIARSGYDLADIHCLDLETNEWHQPSLDAPLPKRAFGRCHASTLVGSKLILFGGSLMLGNTVSYLDLDTLKWGKPIVTGSPPTRRLSPVIAMSGTDLIVYGGWNEDRGELADVHRLQLYFEDEAALEAVRLVAAAAAARAGEAPLEGGPRRGARRRGRRPPFAFAFGGDGYSDSGDDVDEAGDHEGGDDDGLKGFDSDSENEDEDEDEDEEEDEEEDEDSDGGGDALRTLSALKAHLEEADDGGGAAALALFQSTTHTSQASRLQQQVLRNILAASSAHSLTDDDGEDDDDDDSDEQDLSEVAEDEDDEDDDDGDDDDEEEDQDQDKLLADAGTRVLDIKTDEGQGGAAVGSGVDAGAGSSAVSGGGGGASADEDVEDDINTDEI